MKRILCVLVVMALLFSTGSCLAVDYDLPNMSYSELVALKKQIDNEISANHETTSAERSAVEKAFKKAIEDYYGTSNVSWAWIDYSYSKSWKYFTIKTHADITKSDGGKARYDLEGSLYFIDDSYQVIYIKVGNEVLLDLEEEVIDDNRVLKLLGYNVIEEANQETQTDVQQVETNASAGTPTATKRPQATATPAPEITYKRGDKSEDIKTYQLRLIELNYLTGTADGDFGRMTEDAVMRFQKDAGLTVTGIIDKQTMIAMFKSNAPKAKVYRELNFKEISRDPDKYEGLYYKFSGKVLQVLESGSNVEMRVATQGNYDNVVYITYKLGKNESRILEDDRVTIHASFEGLYSYTAVLGNTITLPLFKAETVIVN